MSGLSEAQLLYVYEHTDEGQLEWIWDLVAPGSHGIVPPLESYPDTFLGRREAFLETVGQLLQLGYIRLVDVLTPDNAPLSGSAADQVDQLRSVFPRSPETLEGSGGLSWFETRECPFEIVWKWPGRKPVPLFPGHNPRYRYLEAGWDGRIDPVWEHWRFTPGRRLLDDFESVAEANAFWDSHPDYFHLTPRVERIDSSD